MQKSPTLQFFDLLTRLLRLGERIYRRILWETRKVLLRWTPTRIQTCLKIISQEINSSPGESCPSEIIEQLTPQEKSWLRTVAQRGYVVVPHWLDSETCAQMRNELREILERQKDCVWVDPFGSDHRIFDAGNYSEAIRSFTEDPRLTRMAHVYYNSAHFERTTLGARIEAKEGARGSGQGWHRDSASFQQFKALLYLSDVDEQSGPFQFWPKSHHLSRLLAWTLRYDIPFNELRYDSGRFDHLIEDYPKLVTATGVAGTLLLVDTRGIHRGMPVKKGERFALTNYYWAGKDSMPKGVRDFILNLQSNNKNVSSQMV